MSFKTPQIYGEQLYQSIQHSIQSKDESPVVDHDGILKEKFIIIESLVHPYLSIQPTLVNWNFFMKNFNPKMNSFWNDAFFFYLFFRIDKKNDLHLQN